MDETANRCTCGAVIAPDDVSWPGEDDTTICQECWEAHCDREWTRMLRGEGAWWGETAQSKATRDGV